MDINTQITHNEYIFLSETPSYSCYEWIRTSKSSILFIGLGVVLGFMAALFLHLH